jgi:iron complex outermembrane receptor protein
MYPSDGATSAVTDRRPAPGANAMSQPYPVRRCLVPSPVRRPLAVWCWLALCAAPGAAQAQADPLSLSLEQLMDVKVVGAAKYEQRQNEVAAAVSVITRQEIQAFGWSTLEQALASLPGVYTTYDRQYLYLGTRGFSVPGDYNTRVLITVNGNRANEPLYDGAAFGTQLPLDLALVERIEFIPGPGGAVYGQNAMFGVVNIVTRRGADLDGGRLALAAESGQRLREGRVSWGRRLAGGVDLLLSASAMRARGKDRFFDFGDAGVGGVAAGLDGERDRELFARAAGAGWAAEVVHGDRRKDDPTGVYLSDPLVPGQYQGDTQTMAQIEWQHRLAPALELSTRLFAGRYRFSSQLSYEGSLMSFPGRGDWHGLDLRLLATAWAGHKLMLGLEAQRNPHQDQNQLMPDDPSANLYTPSSGSRLGLYLQDE